MGFTEGEKLKKSLITLIVTLLIGIVAGVFGTLYLPGYVQPYLPAWMGGNTVTVKGTVVAKQKKENSLLLTVETPDGVLLATFTDKIDEINLLIDVKDTIVFTLPKYQPFIEDPRIVQVTRGDQQVAAPAPAPAPAENPKVEAPKEVKPKPKHRQKPPVVVPAPKSRITGTGSEV